MTRRPSDREVLRELPLWGMRDRGKTRGELADDFGLEYSEIVSILESLRARGLVRRIPKGGYVYFQAG